CSKTTRQVRNHLHPRARLAARGATTAAAPRAVGGASSARCRRPRLCRRYKVRGRLIRKERVAVKMAPLFPLHAGGRETATGVALSRGCFLRFCSPTSPPG